MNKLFLASHFSKVTSLVQGFFGGLNLSDIKMAYIPNAEPTKEPKNRSSYKALESLGFKEIIIADIERMKKDEIKGIFDECQAIFGAGGDPIYLINKLRETGMDKLLIQEIEKGKFYFGSSAGSMIMGEKIKTSKHLGQKTGIGFGLVKFSILPHWGEENDEDYKDKKVEIVQETYSEKMSVMTLTDDQVIVCLLYTS
nr:peptidase E [Candidatus Shapirobacteria bacterium]